MDTTPLSGPPIWSFERAQRLWSGLGARQLLDQPLTAFFASRQCPGTAIRAAIDWALEQASARRAVVGGFHSPLEQSVLRLLLEAHSPVVVVLARPVTDARLKPEWETAIAGGSMAVVELQHPSQTADHRRGARTQRTGGPTCRAHRDCPCQRRWRPGPAISFVARSWFAGAEPCATSVIPAIYALVKEWRLKRSAAP